MAVTIFFHWPIKGLLVRRTANRTIQVLFRRLRMTWSTPLRETLVIAAELIRIQLDTMRFSDTVFLIKVDIGRILRKLCEQKGVEIIEAQACPDHIHMLVSIPPNLSVGQCMGYLKRKSALMIFDRHANLKYRYGNRHFWCRGVLC